MLRKLFKPILSRANDHAELSRRRTVSKAYEEKVVNPPNTPMSTSDAQGCVPSLGAICIVKMTPAMKLPTTFTASTGHENELGGIY